MLHGTAIEERDPSADYPLSGFGSGRATESGILLSTTLFDDAGSLGYLDLSRHREVEPVSIAGLEQEGAGELEALTHMEGDRFVVTYNIDGCSWAYAGTFDEAARSFAVDRVLVGNGELVDGVLHGLHFDRGSGRFAAAFCTATSPTQLYVLPAEAESQPVQLTRERALGLAPELLSRGGLVPSDGLRASARLYLPSPGSADGPAARLLVTAGHRARSGRFAWFSMPLIQILTLEGFAVFVPNARGSTGTGSRHEARRSRLGGLDRLDHVHAMTSAPARRPGRRRACGVVGRSCSGY
jgi:dipeptidyl aminopeptidase/acylaminoacyl peptidase